MRGRDRPTSAWLLIPVVALGALVVVAVIDRLQDARAARGFARIERGMAEHDVRAWMGAPDEEHACPETLAWGDPPVETGRNDGRCVREASYTYFDDSWSIGYTADARVVSKLHRRSD